MKTGKCGSGESNDCIVTVRENPEGVNKIIINSSVGDFFHRHIYELIEKTLKEKRVKGMIITCTDRGALDYTIRARLLCALDRCDLERCDLNRCDLDRCDLDRFALDGAETAEREKEE